MDCNTAKDLMVTAVTEGLNLSETLRVHLSQCPSCQTEFDELRRTWVLCGTWVDTEPPAHLDHAVLEKVRAATERKRSWVRWLGNRWVWANAGAAAVLAVAISLFVPYEESLRFCGRALADAGLALPTLPLSFLVGVPYAFVPLLLVLGGWLYLRRHGRETQGLMVGQAYAAIMVPYTLLACLDLGATVIVGILLGTVTGALLGGAVSQRVMRGQAPGAPA